MRIKMIWMPLFFIAMGAAMTAIVMLLWNWLMPVLFGLTLITFWQALGLLVLSKILFGGFCGKHKRGHSGNCGHGNHGWKSKFKAKWQNMSDEDRKKWETKFAGSRWGMGNCGTGENQQKEE